MQITTLQLASLAALQEAEDTFHEAEGYKIHEIVINTQEKRYEIKVEETPTQNPKP